MFLCEGDMKIQEYFFMHILPVKYVNMWAYTNTSSLICVLGMCMFAYMGKLSEGCVGEWWFVCFSGIADYFLKFTFEQ